MNNGHKVFMLFGATSSFLDAMSSIVVIRHVSPEVLGEWSSWILYLGLIQLLTFGTPISLLREYTIMVKNKEVAKANYFARFTVNRFLVIGLFATIILFIINYNFFTISWLSSAAIVLTFLTICRGILSNFFRSSASFKLIGKISVFNSSAVLVFACLINWTGFELFLWMRNLSLMLLIVFLLNRLYISTKVREIYVVKKSHYSTGFKVFIHESLLNQVKRIPKYVISISLGNYYLGLFEPVSILLNSSDKFVRLAIRVVYDISLTGSNVDTKSRQLISYAIIALILTLALACNIDSILSLLNQEYVPSSPLLRIALFILLIRGVNLLLGSYFVIRGGFAFHRFYIISSIVIFSFSFLLMNLDLLTICWVMLSIELIALIFTCLKRK